MNRTLNLQVATEVMDVDLTPELAGLCPDYSGDIRAAWCVVTKMQRDGWSVSIDGKNTWDVWFFDDHMDGWDAGASTAAEAICLAARAARAALAAKEAEVGK